MEYDNTNTGLLTRNDKEGNDKRPDYRGFLNVDGKDYQLSGWVRKRKSDGQPFLSLSVQASKPKPVEDQGAPASVPPVNPVAPSASEEVLPF